MDLDIFNRKPLYKILVEKAKSPTINAEPIARCEV